MADHVQAMEELLRFDGAAGEFYGRLLAFQCRTAPAARGAILSVHRDGPVQVLAVRPALSDDSSVPAWLRSALEMAPRLGPGERPLTRPLPASGDLYGAPPRQQVVLVPLDGDVSPRRAAAYLVETTNRKVLEERTERLALALPLWRAYEAARALSRARADLDRLTRAVELSSAVNAEPDFAGMAVALCNQAAALWGCERVSLGLLVGRHVQLAAASHTENFSRKMAIVRDIEAAMEECLDQDTDVVTPAPPSAGPVDRAARELASRHGGGPVCSIPLRRGSEPVGVLTLERAPGTPFAPADVMSARLALELCAARLLERRDTDRWLGARAMAALRRGLASILGPEHTLRKAAVLAAVAGIGFLVLGRGEYGVEATFVLKATEHQVVPAPFSGYLETVEVLPGDSVSAGETVLATLGTAELEIQLAGARAEQVAYAKRAVAETRDGDTGEAHIARAYADKASAEIGLLEHYIEHARVLSPISGVVVAGELKERTGAPVERGDVLFEVASLESLYAELYVSEESIPDVRQGGQTGQLATASFPGRRVGFVVERVSPAAEVLRERNVFRVRARLDEIPPWMRPGMEGLARISVGRRSYGWIVTHRVTDWLRMKLWL
jgi:biotin carboxyl carrier protein